MGIKYTTDASLSIVFVNWSGVITSKDIADHWTSMLNNKEAISYGRSLADLRECEMQFRGEEIRGPLIDIVRPALRGRGWKVAILVRNPTQYGVARQFQAYTDANIVSDIFTDESAALEWIKL